MEDHNIKPGGRLTDGDTWHLELGDVLYCDAPGSHEDLLLRPLCILEKMDPALERINVLGSHINYPVGRFCWVGRPDAEGWMEGPYERHPAPGVDLEVRLDPSDWKTVTHVRLADTQARSFMTLIGRKQADLALCKLGRGLASDVRTGSWSRSDAADMIESLCTRLEAIQGEPK